jgi:hypothetical protein
MCAETPSFDELLDALVHATERLFRALRVARFEYSTPEIKRASEDQTAARAALSQYVEERTLTAEDAKKILLFHSAHQEHSAVRLGTATLERLRFLSLTKSP